MDQTLIVAIRITLAVLAAQFVVIGNTTASPTRGLLPRSGEVHRSGLAFGIAVGPTALFEIGDLVNVNGLGAGTSLRIGTKATESLQWWVQADGAGFLFSTTDDKVVSNKLASLVITGQAYVQRAFWLKIGFGVVNYRQSTRRQVELDPPDNFGGLTALAGLGIDLVQRGSLALGLEVSFAASIVNDGTLLQLSSGLGFHAY